MQRRRLSSTVLVAATFVATLTVTANAAGAASRRPDATTGSDVPQRVAELRRRTDAHAAMAKSRTQRERIAGEWWRRVAVSPKRSAR